MEDIPNIVFIPIYFAVAGLNVDLTLLNERRDWGYVFATIGIAIATKVVSGTIMAKIHGLFWRESAAVGVLMSCKGIVEIVVLTVGLNAGIISKKIFGMFILMALVSTFVTTPLTQLVYPTSYRMQVNEYIRTKENKKEDTEILDNQDVENEDNGEFPLTSFSDINDFHFTEVINVINTTESISPSLEVINLLMIGKMIGRPETSDRNKDLSRISTGSTLRSGTHKLKKLSWILTKNADDNDTALSVIEEKPCGFETATPLKAIHLRLLTERTTDLLQSSSLYNDDPYFTCLLYTSRCV